MKPLAIDLFCGLGGWAEGFISEGYEVIGFDLERHDYGTGTYPGQLVLQDVLTMHGSQLKDATVIVASPPCQEFSYMSMPWKRAKQISRALQGKDVFPEGYTGSHTEQELIQLFNACFCLQQEACEATGRYIPLIVENVRGAQPWVGRAKWHYGSYYLWGDVPALMPVSIAIKIKGQDWSRYTKTGEVLPHWRMEGLKVARRANIRDGHTHACHLTCQEEHDHVILHGDRDSQGIKQHGSGPTWFGNGIAALPSNSNRRRAASAEIAKIPFSLAQHIARCFKPSAVARLDATKLL